MKLQGLQPPSAIRRAHNAADMLKGLVAVIVAATIIAAIVTGIDGRLGVTFGAVLGGGISAVLIFGFARMLEVLAAILAEVWEQGYTEDESPPHTYRAPQHGS
ncbi:hypothetical protein LO763_11420 [Glycomyces sp. A-F 0318]|uniref:hypothetical protein n=1 Tax=Glycomyces amatae TaxID=2881355 RepID=UPI001E51FD42|nr:hypothetical protein [Glycomyces amatae]MCD0444232.1 hypothetical protein [Glycomyces amatae]